MRKLYTSPEMEIIEFDTKDVITTSGINGFGDSANSDVDAEGNLIWSDLYKDLELKLSGKVSERGFAIFFNI